MRDVGMGLGLGIGALFMVAFWGLLITGGIYVVRNWTGRRSQADQELTRRFAAGEISEDEYRARLTTLQETRTGGGTYV